MWRAVVAAWGVAWVQIGAAAAQEEPDQSTLVEVQACMDDAGVFVGGYIEKLQQGPIGIGALKGFSIQRDGSRIVATSDDVVVVISGRTIATTENGTVRTGKCERISEEVVLIAAELPRSE